MKSSVVGMLYSLGRVEGSRAYAVDQAVESIQKEIMTHGPVEVGFTVYEDFEHYIGGMMTNKDPSYLRIIQAFITSCSQTTLP